MPDTVTCSQPQEAGPGLRIPVGIHHTGQIGADRHAFRSDRKCGSGSFQSRKDIRVVAAAREGVDEPVYEEGAGTLAALQKVAVAGRRGHGPP